MISSVSFFDKFPNCPCHQYQKLAEKESTINELKAKNDKADMEKKLSIAEAIKNIEKERDELTNKLAHKETETQLREKTLNEKFSADLKTKEEIIKMKV